MTNILIFGVVFFLAYKLLFKVVRPVPPPPPPVPDQLQVVTVSYNLGGFSDQLPQDDDISTDDSIDEFKATLNKLAIPDAIGHYVRLLYEGDVDHREVSVRAIFIGNGDIYLDCWWPLRNDTRLFKGERIKEIVTGREKRFANVYSWFASTGPDAKKVLITLGWEEPR